MTQVEQAPSHSPSENYSSSENRKEKASWDIWDKYPITHEESGEIANIIFFLYGDVEKTFIKLIKIFKNIKSSMNYKDM